MTTCVVAEEKTPAVTSNTAADQARAQSKFARQLRRRRELLSERVRDDGTVLLIAWTTHTDAHNPDSWPRRPTRLRSGCDAPKSRHLAFGGGGHRPVSAPGFEAWRRTSTERPGHQRARIRTIGETCNQPRKSTVDQFLWPVGRGVAYCKVDEMDLDFPPAMKRESRDGMLVASARPDRSVPGVVGQ